MVLPPVWPVASEDAFGFFFLHLRNFNITWTQRPAVCVFVPHLLARITNPLTMERERGYKTEGVQGRSLIASPAAGEQPLWMVSSSVKKGVSSGKEP